MRARIVDHAAARRAALVAGVWAPLALLVVGEGVMLVVGATGPARLITHWGAAGADRLGPWWEFPVIVAAVDIPLLALFSAFIARSRRIAGMGRVLAPTSLGLTVMHTLGLGVALMLGNGVAAAPGIAIGGGLALGVAAGLVAWIALPRESAPAAVAPAPAIPLRPGEIAVWTGRVVMPGAFVTALLAIGVVLVVLAAILVVTETRIAAVLFVAPTILLLSVGMLSEWSVAIGPAGVTIRALLGWPSMRIPIAEIASAGVAEVDPVSDFGGWGPRWVLHDGKGRWGFVSRRGTAVEIVRRDGRSVVATVDGAAAAAAVLEAGIQRARA